MVMMLPDHDDHPLERGAESEKGKENVEIIPSTLKLFNIPS